MSNSIIFNLNRARMWSHDHDFVLFEKSIKRIEWYILNESSRMFRTKIISCPHRDRRKYQRNISLRSVQIRCFRSKKKKKKKKIFASSSNSTVLHHYFTRNIKKCSEHCSKLRRESAHGVLDFTEVLSHDDRARGAFKIPEYRVA